MKANQNFRTEEEAVSPVIGVILMVAITVVLAAVVFVLVSDLGGSNESAPAVSFTKNDASDRIEIISAGASADWSRLSVRVTGAALGAATDNIFIGGAAAPHQNEVATLTSNTLMCTGSGSACSGSNVQIGTDVAAILAGDFIEFCVENSAGAAGTQAGNVQILITDTTANSKVWEGTFATVAPCA